MKEVSPPVCIIIVIKVETFWLESKWELKMEHFSYLDKQAQIDVLGLGLGPVDLAILVVPDVDTLK